MLDTSNTNNHEDDILIVELTPCATLAEWSVPSTLPETAFRQDGWTPEDKSRLTTLFFADTPVEEIGPQINRSFHSVRTMICEMGLRRHSLRPWSEDDDDFLVAHYRTTPTSSIAAALGRSCGAVYARAGFLGLTTPVFDYTPWEDAQIKAGYQAGTPISQIGAIIHRTVSSVTERACHLRLRHANHRPDWASEEIDLLLLLANSNMPYREIPPLLVAAGFSERSFRACALVLRNIGYFRGWGRAWITEEDDLLRHCYKVGGSTTALAKALNRPIGSVRWRARELKLSGTHQNKNGFRVAPSWSEEEDAYLVAHYSTETTAALVAHLKRPKAGIYCRAHRLGLKAPLHGGPTEAERDLLRHAATEGRSVASMSRQLNRDGATVLKWAKTLKLDFSPPALRAARLASTTKMTRHIQTKRPISELVDAA